jgi:peptidoglycan/LPS O-acetylase OafA/YrhL
LSHLFLFHNFDKSTVFGFNGSFWSVAVEVQLYCLYPALLLLAHRIGWKTSLYILAAIEITMRLGVGIYASKTGTLAPWWIMGTPFYYWFSWAIGAALAESQLQEKPLPFTKTPAWLWLLLAIGSDFFRPISQFPFLFFALFTVTLIAKAIEKGEQPQSASPIHAHLRLLGTWSYSFYLLHQPLLDSFPYYLHRLHESGSSASAVLANFLIFHPIILFPLCLCTYPIWLGISGLFYRYVELPSMALGKRFLPKPVKV